MIYDLFYRFDSKNGSPTGVRPHLHCFPRCGSPCHLNANRRQEKQETKASRSTDANERRCPVPIDDLMEMDVLELQKMRSSSWLSATNRRSSKKSRQLNAVFPSQWCLRCCKGRRVAIKEANKWNRFLPTDQAQLIFQQSGLGVKDKSVMKELSAAYNQLSPEEKSAFLNKPTRNSTRRLGMEATLTQEELALDNARDSNQDQNAAYQPRKRVNVVQKEMNTWLSEVRPNDRLSCLFLLMLIIIQAVNIAKTYSCEIGFFDVPNHLANHSFQFTRCTPGALESEQAITDIDGTDKYVARLQSLITGQSVSQIAATQKLLSAALTHLIFSMVRFIHLPFTVLTEWPWSDTDHNLWMAGFKLEVSTSPAFRIDWLKTATRDRKMVECNNNKVSIPNERNDDQGPWHDEWNNGMSGVDN
ncbi:hypothetical protein VP01_876g3 [Puccinia sorghi]|uniref:Uncharacterized protein n=1 Tax=Puccinia sorghi TaxID=27349 RepID=A0A0L6U8I8_9BASI|nr:hypothetical protein VP01_876g3 [Puccinia sorghi]